MNLPFLSFAIEDLEAETGNKYTFNGVIGRGSYGVVFKAVDRETGREVAIKRNIGFFQSITDAKRILREIKILSNLNHENISHIIDIVTLPDYQSFDTLNVVLDFMDTDLQKILESGGHLTVEHRKFISYQILRGLKFCHSAQILHRDLKPSNILLKTDCSLQIADFGLARVVSENSNEMLSDYVTTRYYRAPEILMSSDTYGPPIDMWSTGCILAEMILNRPLFPGSGTLNMLQIIDDVLGTPTEDDLEEMTNQRARQYINSLPPREPVPWEQILAGGDPEEIDLISKMLKWDPRKRITVLEALEHPFFAELHVPLDEPNGLPMHDFEFENEDLTFERIKELLWNEVRRFHPDFPIH